jgi:dTDP-4-amino-4,6-dideoxygalactose transaminase
MAVPFIDLQRFEPDFLDRWAEACRRISENTQFVGGPEVARLEERLSAELDVAHTVACANGTDALQLALRAAGVGEEDTVLIPDATFWATFEAVVNVGARVVTVDIDPTDLQMDFELFRQAAETHQPKAAILVHLYGWGSARLDDFRAFCAGEGIVLVEDGAQAVGVHWQGEPIYKGASLATISFYPAKVLGACGDAGAVVTQDADLATRLRQLGNHGRTGHYEHGLVGWNSRMGGFDAAYLNLGLDYLETRLQSRRRAANRYREGLEELSVFTVGPPEGYEENGYLNVTLHDPEERPRIEARLREKGIGFGNVYPGAMSTQPGVRGPGAESFLLDAVGGERADLLARSVLNLPLFAYITDGEIDEVLNAFKAE